MVLGERRGTVQTGDGFAIESERVLKRFESGVPADLAQLEADTTRLATQAGLPASPVTTSPPWTDGTRSSTIGSMVRRGSRMLCPVPGPLPVCPHSPHTPRLDRQRPTIGRPFPSKAINAGYRRGTGTAETDWRQTHSKLDIPLDGQALCHGDLHPGDVFVTDDGPVVIDSLDAGIGYPASDVARTSRIRRDGSRARSGRCLVIVGLFRWRSLQ